MEKDNQIFIWRCGLLVIVLIQSISFSSNAQNLSENERIAELNKIVINDSTLKRLASSFVDSILPITAEMHQFEVSMTIEWDKNQHLDSLRLVKTINHEEFPVSVYFTLNSAPTYIRTRTMGVYEAHGIPIIVYTYPYECAEVVRTNSLYRWRYLDSKNLVLTTLVYYEFTFENGKWELKHYINKIKGINKNFR